MLPPMTFGLPLLLNVLVEMIFFSHFFVGPVLLVAKLVSSVPRCATKQVDAAGASYQQPGVDHLKPKKACLVQNRIAQRQHTSEKNEI